MDFSQFFSDVLSTVIGVGLALWGAIWLDRRTRARNEVASKLNKQARAKKILSLILKELQFNLEALKMINENIASTYQYVKAETWQALSDGGELQSIDDPDLISSISDAYANTRHFALLYYKYFDMSFFPSNNAYTSLKRPFENHTMKAKQDSIDTVSQAIKRIDNKLSVL